jgi:hypothetical protein
MKYVHIFLISFFMIHMAMAQSKADFGIILGGSYYLGDLNTSKQFHSTKPSFGALIRFNLNKRYALRLSGYYMSLGASEISPNQPPYPHSHSFYTNLLDVSGQFEFNFLPYITGEGKLVGSTYIAGGIGYALGLANGISLLTIPFGIGAKFNITERLSTGIEWSFRKTFNDKIDNVSSPIGNNALHNNDWYSTFGLLITYKFVKFAADCAVYK